MEKVRFGLVGVGAMGLVHAKYLTAGEISNAELTAVCDHAGHNRQRISEMSGAENVAVFESAEEMYASGLIDAVLIATPHKSHPAIAIDAFQKGYHVLTEKPAGIDTQTVKAMNQAARDSGKMFGIMYHWRSRPLFQKVKELLVSGELGELKRFTWIATNWYRTQAYYNANPWRATWAGEGGGALINQGAHQLDMWQWLFGLPSRIRAFGKFGHFHDIEVEDEVTAYAEFPEGYSGTYIVSTGETPGTDRLEIVGDLGKLVLEDETLTLWKNRISEREFNATDQTGFEEPEAWKCDVPVDLAKARHQVITENFAAHILNPDAPLLVGGYEGLDSLQLINGMMLSIWNDDWVDVPIDDEQYAHQLGEHVAKSKPKKNVRKPVTIDMTKSFK